MDKITYESRYKFFVSFGIILISLPFVVIYFLSQIGNDLIIENEKYNNLSQISIEIIKSKSALYLNILGAPGFALFVLLFCLGLYFIYIGLKEWGEAQKQDFRSKELELEHKDLENTELKAKIGINDKQKIKKIEMDIHEENISYNYINTKINTNDVIENYVFIKKQVSDKILEDYSKSHDVVIGAEIGGSDFDIIAKAKKLFDKDYIFEIRYINEFMNDELYDKFLNKIRSLAETYSKETNHLPYKKFIVVVENSNFSQVDKFIYDKGHKNNCEIEAVLKKEISNHNYK